MRKALRHIYFVVSIGFLISAGSVTEANAQLDQIFKMLDDHNRALQSLQADLTMVKTNVQLGVSDTTNGSTKYLPKTAKHGSYVRVDWTRPVEEQISLMDDNYELYRPRLNQVIVGKVSKAKNSASVGGALSFLNMSKVQLKANYTTIYLGREAISGGTQTVHIQLTPKTPQSYKLADLWVDSDGMPRQAMITEQNNDTTTVFLSNIKKNVSLDGKIFKLSYPSSVKKIKS